MAIADTVWERLTRFNVPHRRRRRRRGGLGARLLDGAAAVLRGFGLVCVALIVGLNALAGVLVPAIGWLGRSIGRFVWFWLLPALWRLARRTASFFWWRLPELVIAFRRVILAGCLVLVGLAVYAESRTSYVEALLFSHLNSGMNVALQPGPSESIRFPKSGPYDERLGYSQLPEFIASLTERRYSVDNAARWSPRLASFVHEGAFPIYPEKDQAGLRIVDRNGDRLYGVQFPERTYRSFAAIPPLVVKSLLFIEDRYLLDQRYPEHNPAIEWNRFALAAAGRAASLVAPHLRQGGGSTLATQIEKFRHSPRGLTGGVGEKFRQMLTASARAYSRGPDTTNRRKEIITTYLNSTPLSSMPGYGEVIGVPEALWIWFGTDYAEATKVLNSTPRNSKELARKGEIYRQILSLLLSERRPSYYLIADRDALGVLTDKYLRVLYEAGIIDPALRDAALDAALHFQAQPPPFRAVSYVRQKATEDVRNKLVTLLKLPDLYSLDRLDLSAETAVDIAAQARVSGVLQRLSDPAFLRASGMVGKQLLGDGNPAKVTWSFVLYQRGPDRSFVRIHADSLNKPFDINSGAKLMLGSTAKLRTMISYLTIITDLHHRLHALPPRELTRLAASSSEDPLTAWAATYLARTTSRGLQPMLDAAMQRHYSGAPGSFFTGGGTQSFGNFEESENYDSPSVEQAFQHSVNLAFVRLLHDIVKYETAASGVQVNKLLSDSDDPQREAYLKRFVNTDSRRFLGRFYKDYKGLD